jgi:hypothetical protein
MTHIMLDTYLYVFILIIGFTFNDIIHSNTTIIGSILFIIYNYTYNLSINNRYFIMAITPVNYIESVNETHKLITYGFSTIHAAFMALCSTLYLYEIIDNYYIKQAFFISMTYYLADLFYIIDSTKKLKKLDYFVICHHNVLIYYNLFVFIQNDIILENQLLYYLNRGFIAEYSLVLLNYSWYLINTKQENTNKMIVSMILTIISYFITRIINFTFLLRNIWNEDLMLVSSVIIPLVLINYYWFYKIIHKVYRIYNKKNKNIIKV